MIFILILTLKLVDLYAEMFQLDVNERWYFFTPRDRKYPNGNRPNRTAGDGFWKASARDHSITMDDNETIGYKKSLAYHEGKPKNGVKTNWLMKEYRLSKTELDMWVVCEIYKKSEKSEIVKPHHQHNTTVDDGGQGFLSDYGDQRLSYGYGAAVPQYVEDLKLEPQNPLQEVLHPGFYAWNNASAST